ncbi:MAG: hypothetical protein ACI86M_001235 [Saprospiraceae bacterium]|jgi:hypothetical protein
MKKHIFIFLLLIPFLASSQEYEPTLVEGNRWDISFILGMGDATLISEIVHCDTIIDQKS